MALFLPTATWTSPIAPYSQADPRKFVDIVWLVPTAKDLREGDIALIKTGWSSKTWGRIEYFTESPHLTEGAAQWLVRRRVKAVAFDCTADDARKLALGQPTGPGEFPVHGTLLSEGVPMIEHLVNTTAITSKRAKIYAFPLKFKGRIEAAPTRVILFEE